MDSSVRKYLKDELMYQYLRHAGNQVILIIGLWIWALNVSGQKLHFEHLTVEDGLSRNSVLDITQDNFGFMWFATGHGLNRYDGSRFSTYINNPADSNSISDNYINSLFFDSRKTLWVGTSEGLNSYVPETNNFKRIELLHQKGVLQPEVFCVYEDKKNNIWAGTDKGLFVKRSSASGFVNAGNLGLASEFAGSEILCVYEDRFGFLWIGTGRGLVKSRFNQKFSEVETFVHQPDLPGSISDSPIKSIIEDSDGKIWMASESKGLNLLYRNTGTFEHFEHLSGNPNGLIHNSLRKMTSDGKGNILIATQEGLCVFDPVRRTFITYQNRVNDPLSLNQNSLYSLYRDKSENIWIGTYYGGVNVVYGIKTLFKTITREENNLGINHNVVRSIIRDKKGNLWVGTEGGGLNYFDQQTNKFSYYTNSPKDPASLASNFVKTIYIDKSDNIWVGTSGGGLNLLDPANGKFKRFFSGRSMFESKRSAISTILEDSQNRFWVGGIGINGVYQRKGTQLHPIKNFPLMEKLKDKMIIKFFEDETGNLWVVCQTEIYRLSKNNKVVTKITVHNNRGNLKGLNCLIQDHQGNIWFGFYHGGLCVYNPNAKKIIKRYTVKEGLCNDNVLGILEDKQHDLWISTMNGLSRLNPRQETIQNYTISDGLADDEFTFSSVYKAGNGELFFGGMNGITYFLPEEIKGNNDKSSLVFTGLRLFNQYIVPGKEQKILTKNIIFRPLLVFSSMQNIFTLEFALLNYIKSDKNRYAYKLDGVNQDWNETTLPQATYTNLPSGDYVFSVKGANNDGVWSEAEHIQIRILPPFWRSWWAYLIYTIAIAGIVFFVARFFYLKQLLKRDEELHQIKLNFFTNISHEIRSHLSLIMIPLEKVIDESKEYTFVNKQLDGIKKNADRLLGLVTELMDFRKAESKNLKLHIQENDLVGFLNDIYVSFKEVCEKKNLSLSFKHPEQPVLVFFDKEQLEKVVFNLLSNAFKFTPESGQITLEANVTEDETIIKVSDSGKGISPDYFDKLFTNYFQVDDALQNTGYGIGLALSKHIVELHHGKITVSSRIGFTQFTVSLPLPGALARENPIEAAADTPDDKSFTILLAEDNVELRKIIKDLLEPEYRVLESTDGEVALQMARTEIPDLIISDVMMPNKNGFELCAEIKTDERTSHIPVILLTAKDTQSDQISGLSNGADLYLTKPFSIKILQLSVRNILASREKISSKYRKQFIFAPSNTLLNTMDEQFLSRLIAVIEEGMENREFGVDLLADRMGMSQTVLYKKVKALTDMTVNDFSKSIRLKKAAQLLKESGYNVSEVSALVGFIDSRYFTKEFKRQFGQTPREYLNS
ncbi:hybrid sensor histidine kinase/response regulator transcription factor [Pedobacter frigoris]|uniref:histidine kinase n=1 Tax=Pedobacter frigoris TaxID=2571272 RepID=A0A4U1CSD8_9SPHI|nr:hybrid sensor histidine kinase/response regulator transcription factor [Pedobacter frigoris]TKC08839.1 response regulator [Pedobacter frigoris]